MSFDLLVPESVSMGATLAAAGVRVNPNAAEHGFLSPHDGVAISFWVISIAMVAATVFFLWEATAIKYEWKTSMHVGSLVTLIAGVHYFYMREYWIINYASPIVYRYIDWSLTVPLQMIEFYLIMKAANPQTPAALFWGLLLGTVVMLAFGYAGESLMISPVLGFAVGMCGWFFILGLVFTAKVSDMGTHVQSAYNTMKLIVSVGWSIYPLGYYFGFLTGQVADAPLNLIYNLADFVNKIAFCLAIWSAAKSDTRESVNMSKPLLG